LKGISAGVVLADKVYAADEVLRKIEGDGAKAVKKPEVTTGV
jgi:hypothetical protein